MGKFFVCLGTHSAGGASPMSQGFGMFSPPTTSARGSQRLPLLKENAYNLNKRVCVSHPPWGHLSLKY